VLAFAARHRPDAERAFLLTRRPRIEHLDYDWRTNALASVRE
jgi:hypothetical protein